MQTTAPTTQHRPSALPAGGMTMCARRISWVTSRATTRTSSIASSRRSNRSWSAAGTTVPIVPATGRRRGRSPAKGSGAVWSGGHGPSAAWAIAPTKRSDDRARSGAATTKNRFESDDRLAIRFEESGAACVDRVALHPSLEPDSALHLDKERPSDPARVHVVPTLDEGPARIGHGRILDADGDV